MNCFKCDEKLEENAKFCGSCGEKIIDLESLPDDLSTLTNSELLRLQATISDSFDVLSIESEFIEEFSKLKSIYRKVNAIFEERIGLETVEEMKKKLRERRVTSKTMKRNYIKIASLIGEIDDIFTSQEEYISKISQKDLYCIDLNEKLVKDESLSFEKRVILSKEIVEHVTENINKITQEFFTKEEEIYNLLAIMEKRFSEIPYEKYKDTKRFKELFIKTRESIDLSWKLYNNQKNRIEDIINVRELNMLVPLSTIKNNGDNFNGVDGSDILFEKTELLNSQELATELKEIEEKRYTVNNNLLVKILEVFSDTDTSSLKISTEKSANEIECCK